MSSTLCGVVVDNMINSDSLPHNRWKQVLSREQQNIDALLNLAHVDSKLQHDSQALDSLQTVLAIDPTHKEALYEAGQLLYRHEQYQEAVSTLTRLSHIDPHYHDIKSLLNKVRRTAQYTDPVSIHTVYNMTST